MNYVSFVAAILSLFPTSSHVAAPDKNDLKNKTQMNLA